MIRRALANHFEARPLLEEFSEWLEAMKGRAAPKSAPGQVIAYVRSRWTALPRYLDDGRLEIDSGEVERLIRILALGRRIISGPSLTGDIRGIPFRGMHGPRRVIAMLIG